MLCLLISQQPMIPYGTSLTCKLLHLLPDGHMVKMIMELVTNRSFTLITRRGTHSSHAISYLPGSGTRPSALSQASRSCQVASESEATAPHVPAAKQFLRTIKEQNINVVWWADHAWSAEWHNCAFRLHSFIPDAGPNLLGLALPRPAWTRLNHL